MTCGDCQNLLHMYALDALDAKEAEQVRAHLQSGCADCAAELAATRSVLEALPLSLSPADPPPAVRSRLMGRVAVTPDRAGDERRVIRPAARPRRLGRFVEALIAGTAAAAITAAVFWYFFDQQRRSVAVLRRGLDDAQAAIRQLKTSVAQANDSILLLKSPSVQLVSLEGTTEQPRAKAKVYWDQARGEWHFYAANLKPLGDGKTYELWLIDSDQRKTPAGTFEVSSGGEGTLVARAKSPTAAVVAFAVTDEPSGGSLQPTGRIQLVGQLK